MAKKTTKRTTLTDYERGFIKAIRLVERGPKSVRFWDARFKKLRHKALAKGKAK